jgi:adenine/guanine phosphoribosyltransferase-like PRPP-binding protein
MVVALPGILTPWQGYCHPRAVGGTVKARERKLIMLYYSKHADYLGRAFSESLDPMAERLRDILADAANGPGTVDTFVGTGLSGALVVPTLARALGRHWAIVRKQDGSHSSRTVEGAIGERWLFIDDFIEGGATLRRVREAVTLYAPGTEWVGSFEYEKDTYRPTTYLSVW